MPAFDPVALMQAGAAGPLPMPPPGGAPPRPDNELPDWAITGNPNVAADRGAVPAAPGGAGAAANAPDPSFDPVALMQAGASRKLPPPPAQPAPDVSTVSGMVNAVAAGIYGGLADLANTPGNLWNMASNVAAGFGIGEPGQPGYGQVPQLVNPMPSGYQPHGAAERMLYAGMRAAPQVLAFGPEMAAARAGLGALVPAGSEAAAQLAAKAAAVPYLAPVARAAADATKLNVPMVPALLPTAAGGAAQQGAAEAGLPPWAQTGVGIGAALAGGLGQEAALAAGRGVGNLAGIRNVPFETPPIETEAGTMPGRTISVRPGEAASAGQRLSGALGPEGVAAVQTAGPEAIAGDNPTMSELYGAPEMVGLEKAYRTANGPAFLERAQQQNAARIGAVNAMGGVGNVATPGQWFASQLADIDQRTQAAMDAARGGVTGATAAAGGTEAPEALGATARQAVEATQAPRMAAATSAVEQAQAERNSAIASLPAGQENIPGGATAAEATGADIRGQALLARYNAQRQLEKLKNDIDPTGQAGTQAAPFQQAVAAPYAGLPRSAPAVTPGEQQIRGIVGGWSPLVPVSEVFGLRERVGNEISAALSPANPNRAAAARLMQVKSGIDQTLAAIVDQQVQAEQAAVAGGQMAPEATTAARLAGGDNAVLAGSAAGTSASLPTEDIRRVPGVVGREATVARGSGNIPGPSGYNREPGASGAGSTNVAGNRGVAAAAATNRQASPQTLIDFLIRRGGVQDQGGELRALDAQLVHFRKGGRLVNPRGLTPDYAREAAEEAGFLKPGSTPADLYNAVAEEISGRPVYRISEQAEGDARAAMEREAGRNEQSVASARMDALIAADNNRLNLSPREIDRAVELISMGLPDHEAVLAAAHEGQDRALQENAERLAFSGRPGLPAAEQTQMGLQGGGAGGPIRPMTADELAAYRRYLGAAADFKRRFDAGAVGDVLAYGEHRTAAEVPPNISRARGGFGKSDAEVVGQILRKGVTEAEAVRQATDAGIEPETLTGALADELRARAVKPDGSFDLAEFAKFRRDHAGALHVFPETLKAFDGAANAQKTVEDRLAELAAGQAGHPLRGVQTAEVMSKYWQPGDTGGARVRDFARDTGGNPAADRALDDYAVYRLRAEGAIGQDGMVDPTKLANYKRKYAQAIAARPGLQAKLANVDAAQSAYTTAVASRTAALHAYQTKLVQSFIDADDPMKAIGAAFRRGDSGRNIRELKAKLQGNPDAEAGLKRLAGNWILQHVQGMTPEGANASNNMMKAAVFRGFVQDHKDALRELFSGQGIQTLEAIAANMRRSAQRSVAAAGSNTVEKAIGVNREGLTPHEPGGPSAIGALVGEHIPEIVGHAHPALKVAAMVGGAMWRPLRERLRQAGINRRNDLMLAALLHPTTVGRAVLAFANADKPTGLMARQLAVQLQSLAADQQSKAARQAPR